MNRSDITVIDMKFRTTYSFWCLASVVCIAMIPVLFAACGHVKVSNLEMADLLAETYDKSYSPDNAFCPEARLPFFEEKLGKSVNATDSGTWQLAMAKCYLELGQEEKAVAILDNMMRRSFLWNENKLPVMRSLALANMRLGERMNCINGHSAESCIFPIAGGGVHSDKVGSEKAIELFQKVLTLDPGDLESRWLLNIAYMTIGGYPQQVPANFLIKGLDSTDVKDIKPFVDMAVNIGLNTRNMGGGSIVDDFNNDGYLDVVTSSWGLKEGMHFARNNTNGTFTDVSDSSGLSAIMGGLNLLQTDYNNDGWKDILVLRGAWKQQFGKEPNSLLKNNGDGTFSDVTKESGLLSFHPTQTATWADFDNDGWLDLFIGNESVPGGEIHPCELFLNNRNGTFTEIAAKAGCKIEMFVKGVTSGDYDNDGDPDLFLSTFNGQKILLRNETKKQGEIMFSNVTVQAGLDKNKSQTFPTWFWDYDNDGWLDILVCGYEFKKSLAWYSAAEALNIKMGNSGQVFLFHNKQDGTFEEVTEQAGLAKVAFAMGANFGDIDNDGYPDFYLGTGNPVFESLVPNKMFRNQEGKHFTDITTAARVGNLQKGHGISFSDLDNDGDEDIYIDMGGAYVGDSYQSSLYINPGQNNNHWINIKLEGTKSNRAAIGAKLKVVFDENGKERFVYRELNSGGSFGSNPLTQHIGIGQATLIKSIEIIWPGSQTRQVIPNVTPGKTILVKEGVDKIRETVLKKVDFSTMTGGLIGCSPAPGEYYKH